MIRDSVTGLEFADERSALADAVAYALRRVQEDPEFAYHMLHTETFRRLCLAYAHHAGKPIEEIEATYSRDMQPEHSKREPRCAQDRDRVHALETLLDEIQFEDLHHDGDEIRARIAAFRASEAA